MAELEMQIEGYHELLGVFKVLENLLQNPVFQAAMIDCGQIVTEKAKQNLEEMVYSEPETWYKRKHSAGLYGKTMCSSDGVSPPKVDIEGTVASVIVGSFVNYAVHVHFGTGIYAENGNGRQTPWMYLDDDGIGHWTHGYPPKPYLTKALTDSKIETSQTIADAILKIGGGR